MKSSGAAGRIDWLIVAGAAMACAVILTSSGFLWRWDQAIYDGFLQRNTGQPPNDPIIVAVDERSLAELGRWPWPRDTHGLLIDRLSAAGVRAIGLDLLFAEPSANGKTDQMLAEAISRNGRVVVPVVAQTPRLGAPMEEALPIPSVAAAAAAIGHVDVEIDPDGIVRTSFLAAGIGAPVWPSFALALAQVAEGGPIDKGWPAKLSTALNPYRWVRAEPLLIPYLGPPGYFPQVSYVDVLNENIDTSLLRDRVVLVGVTATGLGDSLPTPVSGNSQPMPGVEVIANVYAGIRDNRIVSVTSMVTASALAAALVLLPLPLYPRLRPGATLAIGVGGAVLPLLVSRVLFVSMQLWWPPLGAVAGCVLGLIAWSWRRAVTARASLLESRRHSEATLYSIADGVVTTDSALKVTYMNPVAQTLTGWSATQAIGEPIAQVVRLDDEETGEISPAVLEQAMSTGEWLSSPSGLVVLGRNGSRYGVDLALATIGDDEHRNSGAVLALRDVTASRRLERRIEYQASHDTLTDLPNRNLLRDRIKTAVARGRRNLQRIAIICINLDRFKWTNDSVGLAHGDQILRQIAARLRDTARAEDTVARIGGDEFVVAFEVLKKADNVTGLAQRLIEAIRRPMRIDGQDLFITASIGVSIFPRDASNYDSLLRNAALAMNQAKTMGGNVVRYFSEDMNRLAQRRIGLEQALRRALSEEALTLHFQPMIDITTRRVTGVEALARWNSPEYGQVEPGEFISIAEESGLIVPLGEWVLRTACRQAKAWEKIGLGVARMSVNVSPRQLALQDIPRLVREVTDETDLSPDRLEIEITETVMMYDLERNAETLQELRSLGVHIAVDDFGTGYSSLSFLKRFAVDRIKIDKSFVQDIGINLEGAAIIKAVVGMGRSLGLRIVAEGVETPAQLAFLREHECEEVQGFYMCRPAPASQLIRRLSEAGFLQDV